MPNYKTYIGELTSFGDEDDNKYIKKAVMTLQGNAGAGWVTLDADTYYVRRRTGFVEQRLTDDDDNEVDWDSYDPENGGTGWRATYTVFDAGVETTYTNESITFAESEPYDVNFDNEIAVNSVVEFIDAEAGRIANWLIGVVDADTISADSGNFVLNSATPKITLGAASNYLTGAGFFVGKHSGTYKLHIGNPAGDFLSWSGSALSITGSLTATSITATSGTIGGFTLGATTLTATNLILDSSGQRITLGSSNDIIILDADDATYRLWIGNATAASAPFRVTKAGVATAANFFLTGGDIASTVYDKAVQGWTSNIAFTSTDNDTVSWGAGSIRMQDGTTYSISSGNTGNMGALTYIYLDPAVSITVLQTTTTYSTASGDDKVLIAIAQNHASAGASVIPLGGGQPLINGGDQITALSIVAGNIAASTITAGKLSVTELSAISANLGTITAGTVTAATIRTAASGARVEMNATQLFGTNGTTTQWETDATTGELRAGGGVARLTSTGFVAITTTAYASARSYKFSDGTNEIGGMYAYSGAGGHQVKLQSSKVASHDSVLELWSDAATGETVGLNLYAAVNTVVTASLEMGGPGTPDNINLTATTFELDAQLSSVLEWSANDTYDIGNTTSNRPRNLYLSKHMYFLEESARASGVYDKTNTDTTVGNTATETTVYNKTIDANDMLTNGGARLFMHFEAEQSSGANKDLSVRVKFGATTLVTLTVTIATDASSFDFQLEVMLFNTATNAQRCAAKLSLDRDDVSLSERSAYGTAAEDTTASKALVVTAQWSAADPATTLTRKMAVLEIMP